MPDATKAVRETLGRSLFEGFKTLLISIIPDIGVTVFLKKYIEEHGSHAARKLAFKLSGEHRARLLGYIQHMKHGSARDGLQDWYHQVHERNDNGHPGEEDRWVRLLAELLYYCEEFKLDTKLIFNTLGCIRDPKEREEALDFLEQDWFRQLMKRIKLALKELIPSKKTLNQWDKKVAKVLQGFHRTQKWLLSGPDVESKNAWSALWDLVLDLWESGNVYAQIGIALVVGWTLLTFLVSLSGNQMLIAIAALIPLLGVFAIIFAQPLLWGVVASFSKGRAVLARGIGIVGFELLLGVALAFVPMGNDVKAIPFFVLTIMALTFIYLGFEKGWMRTALISILWVLLALQILNFARAGEKTNMAAATEKAQAEKPQAPGSTICPGAGTIKVPAADLAVIPLDTCQSGLVKLPDTWKGVRMKTVDPSQSLGIAWYTETLGIVQKTGETVWIGGDQILPLDPKGRIFRVWSDRKGELEIRPKEVSGGAQTASTSNSKEVPEEEAGWTYVEGEVRWVDEYNWRLVVSSPEGVTDYYADGLPVQSPYYSDGISIRWLNPKDQIRIRLNKKGEVDRIWVLKEASKTTRKIS
jgi:hypothetical protein